mmetsp:Transcript_20295/g.32755  ORF Transcript_20295/g.32755 Transcript_20295/m.32755 type:complete len:214 (-) Transcript_20295:586-1227(-)
MALRQSRCLLRQTFTRNAASAVAKFTNAKRCPLRATTLRLCTGACCSMLCRRAPSDMCAGMFPMCRHRVAFAGRPPPAAEFPDRSLEAREDFLRPAAAGPAASLVAGGATSSTTSFLGARRTRNLPGKPSSSSSSPPCSSRAPASASGPTAARTALASSTARSAPPGARARMPATSSTTERVSSSARPPSPSTTSTPRRPQWLLRLLLLKLLA